MKTMILLDDDTPWRVRATSAFEKRGYTVTACASLKEAHAAMSQSPYDYGVFDLKLEDGSSLQILDEVKEKSPAIKLVILTGYGNFATAVTAIKQGAANYLAKPADIDEIEAALHNETVEDLEPTEELMSANRVKWEYIQRTLLACEHNISEAARKLKMHRRTLQRILAKHAPRE